MIKGVASLLVFICSIVITVNILSNNALDALSISDNRARDALEAVYSAKSTSFQVVNLVGDRKVDANENSELCDSIQVLTVTVRLRADCPAVDLSKTMVYISSDYKHVNLELDNDNGTTAQHASATTFVACAVYDSDSSFATSCTLTADDMVNIIISLDSEAVNMTLRPGRELSVKLQPENGLYTLETLSMPSFGNDRYVSLV